MTILLSELKAYTDSVHIEVVIASSTCKEINGEKYRSYGVIKCHRHGRDYVPKGTPGSRNKNSGKCNCPFLWTINSKTPLGNNGDYKRYFFIKAITNEHNHRTNKAIFKCLSAQRRLTEEQLQ